MIRSSRTSPIARAHPDLVLTDRGRCVSRCGGTQGAWRAACTEVPMASGAYYAEFTIERKIYGHFFGVIRPGWNVEGGDAMYTAPGHCLYVTFSGHWASSA